MIEPKFEAFSAFIGFLGGIALTCATTLAMQTAAGRKQAVQRVVRAMPSIAVAPAVSHMPRPQAEPEQKPALVLENPRGPLLQMEILLLSPHELGRRDIAAVLHAAAINPDQGAHLAAGKGFDYVEVETRGQENLFPDTARADVRWPKATSQIRFQALMQRVLQGHGPTLTEAFADLAQHVSTTHHVAHVEHEATTAWAYRFLANPQDSDRHRWEQEAGDADGVFNLSEDDFKDMILGSGSFFVND